MVAVKQNKYEKMMPDFIDAKNPKIQDNPNRKNRKTLSRSCAMAMVRLFDRIFAFGPIIM